jgi:RND family efflux transporter MFP subunit
MKSANSKWGRCVSTAGRGVVIFLCTTVLVGIRSEVLGKNTAVPPDNHPKSRLFQIPHGIAQPSLRSTMSAPLQGVLMEVNVTEGASVEKGQILAVIDNRVAQAAVKMARVAADQAGAIEHAKYELALAESLLTRLLALERANAGAQYELEEARVRRDQAKVGVRTAAEQQLLAERKLEMEEARLESHNIRAPFSGIILSIERAAGTSMTPSDPLLTLVSLEAIEAELYLPLRLFRLLQEGKSYRLRAQTPVDRELLGRLTYAAPVIDSATGTFRCVFSIDNPNQSLPAGFSVRFDLSHPEPDDSNTRQSITLFNQPVTGG